MRWEAPPTRATGTKQNYTYLVPGILRGHLIPLAGGYAVVLHSAGAAADLLLSSCNANTKEATTAAAAVAPADKHRKEELFDGAVTVPSHLCFVAVGPCL